MTICAICLKKIPRARHNFMLTYKINDEEKKGDFPTCKACYKGVRPDMAAKLILINLAEAIELEEAQKASVDDEKVS